MGILDRLKGNKTDKITKLNRGLLDSWQCRCVGGDPECKWQIHFFRLDWCGLSPSIEFECPARRPPREV